ncbi:putative chlorogenate esterase [Burkholderia pseudomallei MSHR7334]|nr:putative chlorogenate esterase [Burkholderia pseudomallei MSHR7334]
MRRPARSEGVWRRPDNSTPPPLARAREPPRCGAGLPNRWLSLPRARISKPRSSSDRAGDLRDERRLCGIRVVVHDAAGRSGPVRAQAPRRQADRLSRHERSGVLVDRYDRLVRARDAGERRRCERLRALFSRRGDEPLLGRARRRPVRHADAACRVGRGRQGTGRDRRDRARRVERGTQSRGAGVMGRGAHAAAVPVSARRAIRRRRRERGGELQLPVTPSARAPRGA